MTYIRKLPQIGRFALITALAAAPALAVDVTYSTTGSFSGGGGSGNTLTGAGGLTIIYTGLTNATVTPAYPTNAQFGSFSVTAPAAGASDAISSHFSLTVTETAPATGVKTLTDIYSGTITAGSSNVKLSFTGGSGDGGAPVLGSDPITGAQAYSFTIGGVTYYVDQVTPINPSSTGGGVSTINGAIDASGCSGAGFLCFHRHRLRWVAGYGHSPAPPDRKLIATRRAT